MAILDNLKRGSVELVLLTLLNERDMYGYELCQEINNRSNSSYVMSETSLYPALYRLAKKGYISNYDEKAGKRRFRVYYHLEPSGIEYLECCLREYCKTIHGILNILQIRNLEELERPGE